MACPTGIAREALGCRLESVGRLAALLSAILALSMLCACGRENPEQAAEVSGEERARLLAAVEGLRTVFNQGHCERVLDLAVERLRTENQSRKWVGKCGYIRETLGDWRSFEANYWYRAGESAVAVEGAAGFAKDAGVVQVVWDLESASPRMVFFFLRSETDQVDFPEMQWPLRIDPPTKKGRKRMESAG